MTSDEEKRTKRQIEQRRDKALRVALNTPPKRHAEMKKGNGRKPQKRSTASEKRT